MITAMKIGANMDEERMRDKFWDQEEKEKKVSPIPFLLQINKLTVPSNGEMKITVTNPSKEEQITIFEFDSYFFTLFSEDFKLFKGYQDWHFDSIKRGINVLAPGETVTFQLKTRNHDPKNPRDNPQYRYSKPAGYFNVHHRKYDKGEEAKLGKIQNMINVDDFLEEKGKVWAVCEQDFEFENDKTEKFEYFKMGHQAMLQYRYEMETADQGEFCSQIYHIFTMRQSKWNFQRGLEGRSVTFIPETSSKDIESKFVTENRKFEFDLLYADEPRKKTNLTPAEKATEARQKKEGKKKKNPCCSIS
ncbi:hypothetical protein GCK72_011311 [Caenorhabditis remanei]|uniref:Uncharacterized protein n=1 Tax=Caenorhabditis remanei TaxID=31234 RepID=A0A6A5H844_CAERE|nr:hypothetical protein GCK72_011311 [Caenorhabditis remanei]KAF1763046.1 hypothetical protein GCK72_011311 [Caenorhabditis remanei]